eukprot:8308078-Alexandrium_andersonii.AAC.1
MAGPGPRDQLPLGGRFEDANMGGSKLLWKTCPNVARKRVAWVRARRPLCARGVRARPTVRCRPGSPG